MNTQLILIPRMSEKAYGLSQVRGTYVFDVDGSANKHTVARAVAEQYDVTVVAVRVTNQKGKAKRTVRKGGRPVAGRTSDVKKAYVTIQSGQNIPVFAAVEAAEAKQEATQEKLDKVAAKQAGKEAKQAEKEAKKSEREKK